MGVVVNGQDQEAASGLALGAASLGPQSSRRTSGGGGSGCQRQGAKMLIWLFP